jgi:hypothetical protein
MELGTSLVGLVILAICILPIWLMRRNNRKKEEHLINGLRSIAAAHHRELGAYDCGFEFAIGMAQTNDFVFFYKTGKEKPLAQYVALNTIRKCQIDHIRRSVKSKEENKSFVERLTLTFIPKDREADTIQLEFFNADEQFQLSGEQQLIEKWEATVNVAIRRKIAA